jgi:hypothetical protein
VTNRSSSGMQGFAVPQQFELNVRVLTMRRNDFTRFGQRPMRLLPEANSPECSPEFTATPGNLDQQSKHYFLANKGIYHALQLAETRYADLLINRFRVQVPAGARGNVLLRFLLDKRPSGPPLRNFDTCLTDLQDLLDTWPPLTLAESRGRWPNALGVKQNGAALRRRLRRH